MKSKRSEQKKVEKDNTKDFKKKIKFKSFVKHSNSVKMGFLSFEVSFYCKNNFFKIRKDLNHI